MTIPGTSETAWPTSGERCAAPWISLIRLGGPTIVNDQAKSPAIVSGGSSASRSDTWPATIVAVQVSPAAKSTSGARVKVVGPPEATAVCAPLTAHEMENHAPATATGSPNVTLRSESGETPVAPAVGVVATTCGAASATTAEWEPRPVKSSVAKPSHSTAGSNTSPGVVSPASIVALRRSVLSAVLVEAGSPLGAGIDAELADHVQEGRALPEHDDVVAVEPAGPVRLVGLREDRGARGALREHEDVAGGDGADERDVSEHDALPLKHICTA